MAIREAVSYINKQYRGRQATAAGRNVGRANKKWLIAQVAKMIEVEMRGDGVTVEEIHTFIDAAAGLLLDDD